MSRFERHKWWVLTVFLTAPMIALAAGVPNVFAPNTVISSAAVNANFANLDTRLSAVEAHEVAISAWVQVSTSGVSVGSSANWISGTSRVSAGVVILTFTSGLFSGDPQCTATSTTLAVPIVTTPSIVATAIEIHTLAIDGTPTDGNFELTCVR